MIPLIISEKINKITGQNFTDIFEAMIATPADA